MNPRIDRPQVPDGYGVPEEGGDFLDWDHVSERMEQAKRYWLATTSPDGSPYPRPIDAVWIDDALYVAGDSGTRWNRNVAKNSAVVVHLENAWNEVVILHGVAVPARADPSLAERLAEASNAKYGYGASVEDYQSEGVLVIRASRAYAWTNFPYDVTRFLFD